MAPHQPPVGTPDDPGEPGGPNPLGSTADLIRRIQAGDTSAFDQLFARIHKPLHRFAHGRLPAGARDLNDTEDLVQSALIRAFDHLDEFDPRHEGSFLAYLRRCVLNRITDLARKSGRRPHHGELPEDLCGSGPSPLEIAVGKEALERYENALERLPEAQRQAVMLRVEMGHTYEEIARAVGFVTTDAARMAVTRAIARLAKIMRASGPQGA